MEREFLEKNLEIGVKITVFDLRKEMPSGSSYRKVEKSRVREIGITMYAFYSTKRYFMLIGN